MTNYTKVNITNEPRIELHDNLALTGAEVSINSLPAGTSVPFVHFHKNNEEIYGVLTGSGKGIIDGDEMPLTAVVWLQVSRSAKRQFFAAADKAM